MSAGPLFGAVDQAVFLALNQIVGRSFALDSLIVLALENPVAKAGLLGACFLFAWFRAERAGESATRRRRLLAVTLVAVFLAAPAGKLLSEGRFAPRPFVAAMPALAMSGDRLAPVDPIAVRLPQTGDLAARAAALQRGAATANDFDGFPSDHAAIYFAFALGILLACRRAGWLAMAWTIGVIFGLRIAVGMHWLSDIAVGAAVGGALLLALQLAGRALRRPIEGWLAAAGRAPGLTSAILFLLLIEAVGTMRTFERLRDLGGSVAERLL
jgi:undecaprenyl-diphosphatase